MAGGNVEAIIADFGRPNKSGSVFEHRLDGIPAALTERKKPGLCAIRQ
jgi:hypothetical protein